MFNGGKLLISLLSLNLRVTELLPLRLCPIGTWRDLAGRLAAVSGARNFFLLL